MLVWAPVLQVVQNVMISSEGCHIRAYTIEDHLNATADSTATKRVQIPNYQGLKSKKLEF